MTMTKTRFSLAVAVVLMAVGIAGVAQQNDTFAAKPSNPQKVKPTRSSPAGKMPGVESASAANARDLQSVEHENPAKSIGPSQQGSRTSRAGGKKTTAGFAPAKDHASDKNPPINFGAGGGTKKSGLISQGPDPYKGRLKEKKHQ